MTHDHPSTRQMDPVVVRPERRNDASAALIHLVDALTQQVHAMNDKLDAHMAAQAVERKNIIEDLIKRAVPDGDLDGHYNYHNAAIEAQRKKAEFWEKMKYELVRWGLIGFIAWAILFFGNAAWLRVLEGPHK
jgi:hypothetical protein